MRKTILHRKIPSLNNHDWAGPYPIFFGVAFRQLAGRGKENRTPASGAMQDPLFTEKEVTPDDHYEKARAWAVGNRTWHDRKHVGGSRIYLGIPPGLFPRNSCIILKKAPHYNGHRRNRPLRCILQGIPKGLQGLQTGILG